jgi:hypothetical protein
MNVVVRVIEHFCHSSFTDLYLAQVMSMPRYVVLDSDVSLSTVNVSILKTRLQGFTQLSSVEIAARSITRSS